MPGEGAQQNRYTVLIDPAHGGEEAGVVADKLREKDLTMNLALLIREESQKVENLQVRLTRSTDRTMTVAERIKAAGDFKPDCLISLHVNAGFGKKATGYEVYFPGFRQNVSGGRRFLAYSQGYGEKPIPQRFRETRATDPGRPRNGLPPQGTGLAGCAQPAPGRLDHPGAGRGDRFCDQSGGSEKS